MRKKLFTAFLVAGTTLGFAKEAKQRRITPITETVNSFVKKENKVFGHLQHVFFYEFVDNGDGTGEMHVYDFYIWVP